MKQHFLAILLITTISIAIYANTLKNGFVYDDKITVIDNSIIIGNLSNLQLLFDKKEYFPRSGETSYRPVVTFTYFIDYALYGLKPSGYHITNILLHTANGVLLYAFLTLLFNRATLCCTAANGFLLNNPPLSISLLFATHPALTEAVNAISYREDLLAFLFYLGTLIIYLLLRSTGLSTIFFYPLSCFFYLLALFSKEMALTLPLIVYSLDLICFSSKNKSRMAPNSYIIGYIAITIIYLYLRFYLFYNPTENEVIRWPFAERLLTTPWLILRYIFLLLVPINLSAEYTTTPIESLFSSAFIIPSSIVICMLIIALITLKKKKEISFGILFFAVTFIPAYNIVPIANPFAERYLYLPTIGFCIIIWSIISYLLKGRKSFYLLTTLLIVLGIYSLTTVTRNKIWRDEFSLWFDAVKKVPMSSRAQYSLGNAYANKGLLDEAIQHYNTALQLEPNNEKVHYGLGVLYTDQGQIDKAEWHYKIALRLKTDYVEAYNNLGILYAEQGRLDEAIWHYKTALHLKPDYAKAHNNLGNAYANKGLLDEAIRHYNAALRLKPDFSEAYHNLETLYLKKRIKESTN